MPNSSEYSRYEAIVIGTSAGGLSALLTVLPMLPEDFPLAIVVVQHVHRDSGNFFAEYLHEKCQLRVKEAEEKESIQPGVIYTAPANYHLLIEHNRTFALTIDEKVNYSRPSIDVLFDAAAQVYGSRLIGIVLTGANADGAKGLKTIKAHGGLAIVQDPDTAESEVMPASAIEACQVDYIAPLEKIPEILLKIVMENPDRIT